MNLYIEVKKFYINYIIRIFYHQLSSIKLFMTRFRKVGWDCRLYTICAVPFTMDRQDTLCVSRPGTCFEFTGFSCRIGSIFVVKDN